MEAKVAGVGRRARWCVATACALLLWSVRVSAKPARDETAVSTPAASASKSAASVVELYERARGTLARLAEARARAARRPIPVAVRWAPRRIATLEPAGAIGAMIGADLDGDGAHELYAVSGLAISAYVLSSGKLREIARLPFSSAPAAIRPRDEVVSVAVDLATAEVVAGSSSFSSGVRARWRDGRLVLVEELDGMPLCAHRRGRLARGKNTFVEVAEDAAASLRGAKDEVFGVRCREVILADGHRAETVTRLPVDGALEISVIPACDTAGCAPSRYEVAGAGVAFDVGDLDRDGRVEVAFSGAGAPGDPDAVRVVSAADPRRTLHRRAFTGGVAALALVDLDGDGALEVVVAVRLPGSPRVDVWRLNE